VTPPRTTHRRRTTGTGAADGRRGLALRGLRDQRRANPARREPARGHRLARRAAPGPRPGRGPLQAGQHHRRQATALPQVHRQHRLVPHPGHRHRPDRLAQTARRQRPPRPRRTSHLAVPDFPRPGQPHPRPATTLAELPTRLALDHSHPNHLHPTVRTAHTHLNTAATTQTTAATHRLENGAHRGDTRRINTPPARNNTQPETNASPCVDAIMILKRRGIPASISARRATLLRAGQPLQLLPNGSAASGGRLTRFRASDASGKTGVSGGPVVRVSCPDHLKPLGAQGLLA
jgi:hypothetical protein